MQHLTFWLWSEWKLKFHIWSQFHTCPGWSNFVFMFLCAIVSLCSCPCQSVGQWLIVSHFPSLSAIIAGVWTQEVHCYTLSLCYLGAETLWSSNKTQLLEGESNSSLHLNSDICTSILTFGQTPQHWPTLAPKKGNKRSKKDISRIHIGLDFLQKRI